MVAGIEKALLLASRDQAALNRRQAWKARLAYAKSQRAIDDAEMLRRREAGETFVAIGRDYGITGQRVSHRCRRARKMRAKPP